jgi:hypothetical protein
MWHDPGRRRINLAASLSYAKQCFSALVIENTALREDLARVREQRDEALALLDELRAAVRARHAAEAELAGLYREREIQRARSVQRDPAKPLH